MAPDRHPLTALIDEVDLLGESNWNKRHVLVKGAVSVTSFIDEAELLRMIELPLLRKPYFSVLKEGVWANPDRVTRSERLYGESVDGLANAKGIRQALRQGATLKLNQLEDWHRPSRVLVDELQARIPAELKAYLFYTPQDNTGMLPHRDGSHVVAVQLSGSKQWRLYATAEQIDARPGLDIDPDAQTDEFLMEPGDVLYLPHGYPHAATARSGTSLHLTLTITEPSVPNLVEALLATFLEDSAYLMREHPRFTVSDKTRAVAKGLLEHIETADSDRVIATALSQMRHRIVSP